MRQVAAIVVAAGRGTRAGEGLPKQYRRLGAKPLLAHALDALLADAGIGAVLPVIGADDGDRYGDAAVDFGAEPRLLSPTVGGDSRQASVRHGLDTLDRLPPEVRPDLVLIHDGARPFVGADLIARAVAAGDVHGAAVPGISVHDTIKLVDAASLVRETPERSALRAIQTPQCFAFEPLLAAHRRAAASGLDGFTDDGALAEWAGMPVHVFEGDRGNLKLTTFEDFEAAERRFAAPVQRTHVGTGYDVHAFEPGDHLWLGGVRITHGQGVKAHSDGDVVLHALTDAVLGALADGDIGLHFPPADPAWRAASSDRFLAFAADRVAARRGVIDHLDATVICEAPRVGPYREAMRERVAAIAGIPVAAVSIKATTSEGLGFTGRREGIAAQATATLRLPVAT